MKKILITGGTGLIGSRLAQILQEKGYKVIFLSRKKGVFNGIECFQWDISKGKMDEEALKETDAIIHLAGAGIADERWTASRKKEILESRTKSTELLINTLKKISYQPKVFISSSAIGYYGGDTGADIKEENSRKGYDFLADVTAEWEKVLENSDLDTRKVWIRTGVVLSSSGGALPKMALSIKYWLGSYLGTGNQYISWIHLDDLCQIFIKALEDQSLNGAYNGVAPNPVTNKEFTILLANNLKRWVLPIYVPSFFLKMLLGEMAVVVTGSSYISCKKILETGFTFKYRTLQNALSEIYP
jgi:hypothetical protein